MTSKCFLRIVFAVTGLLAAAGCASSSAADGEKGETAPPVFTENKDGSDPHQAFAAIYVRDFFAAVRDDDYQKFHSLLSGRAAQRFTPAKFQLFRAELAGLGKMRDPEYLGMLDNTTYRDYLWRVVFDSDDGRKTGVFFCRLIPKKEGVDIFGIEFKRF